MGRSAEAEVRLREVVAGSEKSLGATHTTTLRITMSLAGQLYEEGRADEAATLQAECISQLKQSQGEVYAGLYLHLEVLSEEYVAAKRFDEAIACCREWIEVLGVTDDSIRTSVVSVQARRAVAHVRLGEALLAVGKIYEAVEALEPAFGMEELQRETPEEFHNGESLMGEAYFRMDKTKEAEHLLTNGAEGLLAVDVPHFRLCRRVNAVDRLVKFYNETGQPELAAKWTSRIDSASPRITDNSGSAQNAAHGRVSSDTAKEN